MKLIVLLTVVAWSNGAKLDKAYLPPANAQTSGGSGNFLQTPIAGPSNDFQRNSFARGPSNGFARTGANVGQNGFTHGGFGQSAGAAHNSNGFAQGNNASPQQYGSAQGNFAQQRNYDQEQNYAQNEGNFNNGFGNFEGRPERAQAAFERNAAILRQDNQNDGESYAYAYETENGIIAEENGVATNGVEAQGGYSYTGDDGQVYSIRYTADQNGFVPQGDHLPTPPPVPEEILRALEQNARDEAAGIYDDGSYNEAKYGSGDNYANNNYNGAGNGANYNGGNNYNGENNVNTGATNFNNEPTDDDDTIVTTNALFRNNQGGSRGSFGNQSGFGRQGGSSSSTFGNNQGAGFRNQATNKAYLPPSATQRSGNGRNGFARRQPSFSERSGYQY